MAVRQPRRLLQTNRTTSEEYEMFEPTVTTECGPAHLRDGDEEFDFEPEDN